MSFKFESLEEISCIVTTTHDDQILADAMDRFIACRDALKEFRMSLTDETLHLEDDIEALEMKCDEEAKRAERYITHIGDDYITWGDE